MRWLPLLALIGCGDNHPRPVTAEPTSGARLRLERLVYTDGTRQLASTATVFDRDRDEPCTIARWSDGLRYCTPDAFPTVYTDHTCTTELAHRRSVERLDRHYALHQFEIGDLPLPSRLFELGAEVPRSEVGLVFRLRDGVCSPRGDIADQDRFYVLGAEVDRAALVHTRRVEVPAGDRLAAQIDTSPDGLQLPALLFDTEQQRDCSLVPHGDTATCEPVGATLSTRFADAACTVPAVVVPSALQPPELVRVSHGLACATFHEIGELVVTTTAYTRSGSVCTEAPLSVGERVFGLREPIELAHVARERIATPRRLQAIEAAGIGFPDPSLFDSTLGLECTTNAAGDLRCLPSFETARPAFSDPGCLAPILVFEVAPSCEAPPAMVSRGDRFHPLIGPISEVFELTTGDRCAPALHLLNDSTFHLAGDALQIGNFVPAMRLIE